MSLTEEPIITELQDRTGRWAIPLGLLLSVLLHLGVGALFFEHFGRTTLHVENEPQVVEVESIMAEPPKPEPPKVEPQRQEAPKPEPPKAPESPKPEPEPQPEKPKPVVTDLTPKPAQPEPPPPPPPPPPRQAPPPQRAATPPPAPQAGTPPPAPQLERGRVGEKSSTPRQATGTELPAGSPQAPSADGLARMNWETGGRSEAWVKATLDKSAPVTQSEHDFLLAQIIRMWRFDVASYPGPDLIVTVRALVLPNGELGSPLNKADRFEPAKLIPEYRQLPPYVRQAADSFLLAIRLAQPLELPPHPAGYWPKRMQFQFRLKDVKPFQPVRD